MPLFFFIWYINKNTRKNECLILPACQAGRRQRNPTTSLYLKHIFTHIYWYSTSNIISVSPTYFFQYLFWLVLQYFYLFISIAIRRTYKQTRMKVQYIYSPKGTQLSLSFHPSWLNQRSPHNFSSRMSKLMGDFQNKKVYKKLRTCWLYSYIPHRLPLPENKM